MRGIRGLVWFLLTALVVPCLAGAQTTVRRPTTIDALRRFPGYYHMQSVLLRGEIGNGLAPGELALRCGENQLALLMNDVTAPSGTAEIGRAHV